MFFDKSKDMGSAILGPLDNGAPMNDDPDEGVDFLKGIAEEMIKAIHGANAEHLVSCLDALVAHIQAQDTMQDADMS